ncbi:uncharacterized protein LOC125941339 [Dermacentor silvarum]|uniref:uncharacterized protein LOC125941339 n=1 Tax=Dermacentor silvarum TaxID=543639 RepID=UPI002100CCAB|nr:uncharacterized protein LOC125941339 [Dermacentor silvarum]
MSAATLYVRARSSDNADGKNRVARRNLVVFEKVRELYRSRFGSATTAQKIVSDSLLRRQEKFAPCGRLTSQCELQDIKDGVAETLQRTTFLKSNQPASASKRDHRVTERMLTARVCRAAPRFEQREGRTAGQSSASQRTRHLSGKGHADLSCVITGSGIEGSMVAYYTSGASNVNASET